MKLAAGTFLGYCDDAGHAAIDDRKGFKDYVAAHFAGQEFMVTVQARSAFRSKQANSYYWSVVVAAAVQESGQDADAIHAMWCDLFLPNERKRLEFFNRLTGSKFVMDVDPRRSSKQTGTKFYDYVEACRLWLQEWLGVTTPDPDPEYWRKRAKTDPEDNA